MNFKLIIILILLFILWKKKEHFDIEEQYCSKLCCGTQYPVPFKMKYDEYLDWLSKVWIETKR